MQRLTASLLALLLMSMVAPACKIEGTKNPTSSKAPFVPPEGPAPYVPESTPPAARKLVLLHTNDEHSHLLGFGSYADFPFLPNAAGEVTATEIGQAYQKIKLGADQQTVGGMVRRQYLVNKIRAESEAPVMLVSAGDATMGTIFHPATPLAAPDYVAMTLLGYDFATLGNHEFDFGSDVLAKAVAALQNNTFGGGLQLVASNTNFSEVADTGSGSALKHQMGEGGSGAPIVPWAVKTLANGLKVGFVGFMGYEAALVAPAASPVSFSVPADGAVCETIADCDSGERCARGHCVNPLNSAAYVAAVAADVQPVITALRDEQKVDVVVALSHSGVAEDNAYANLLSGVDVIIGGHSHDFYPATVVNNVILVQAGWYGLALGKLTISVAPDGVVSLVQDESEFFDIDYTLDTEILGDTDLTVSPPVIADSFETALTLTGGVLGPVVAGMNAALAPAMGVPGFNVLAPLVTSNHDIQGELLSQDSPLMHLVTDANRNTVLGGACTAQTSPGARYVVAVQANGVLRESLRFSKGASKATTFADIFSVVPLGASPFNTSAPGYPMVMFQLDAGNLFAGLDVGVTQGLSSDSFFLGYSGLKIEYDATFAPLDSAALALNPMMTGPTGRVMKVDAADGMGGYVNLYTYNELVPWAGRWNAANFNVMNDHFLVITNMYLAGFLEAFGMTPLHPYTGGEITPNPLFGSLARIAQTIVCQDAMVATADCGNAEGPVVKLRPCLLGPGNMDAQGQWALPLVEVKEWGVLAKYMLAAFPTGIPDAAYPYPMAAADVRVKDVTPAE